MARFVAASQSWELDVQQDWIDTTMGIPTLDPDWRGTDSNGHEHYYDQQAHEYPTLDYIIDAEHWCDGTEGVYNHDPHMAVDEDHYECKLCREVVEPGIIPAGTPSAIPGSKSATLAGVTSSGMRVKLALTGEDYDAIEAADGAFDPDNPAPSERDLVVQRILDEAVEQLVTSGGRNGSRVLLLEQR